MGSTYGIITLTQLQDYKSIDYSTLQATGSSSTYSDTVVEAWISQAERLVVAYTKQTYTADNAPAAVISVIMELAGIIADNQLIKDGFIQGITVRPFLDNQMMALLDSILDEEKEEGAVVEVISVEEYTE